MHAALRNAAVLLACRRKQYQQALDLAEAARQYGHADACLLGLRAHALSCLGRHQEAGEWYTKAFKLGPNDPYVRHLAATAGTRVSDQTAPAEYVQTLFDAYAPGFDGSLIRLGYRIPGVIRAAVQKHAPLSHATPYGPALDLGCGTGLLAVALSDLSIRPIHGVDLSPRMLAKAAERNLYDLLQQADLLDALNQDGPAYSLIFAADVLCYLGALDPLLGACFRRLTPSGFMLAWIEEAQTGDPRRQWLAPRVPRPLRPQCRVRRTRCQRGRLHRRRSSARNHSIRARSPGARSPRHPEAWMSATLNRLPHEQALAQLRAACAAGDRSPVAGPQSRHCARSRR